jgi:hypothetical protein
MIANGVLKTGAIGIAPGTRRIFGGKAETCILGLRPEYTEAAKGVSGLPGVSGFGLQPRPPAGAPDETSVCSVKMGITPGTGSGCSIKNGSTITGPVNGQCDPEPPGPICP